MLVSLSVTNITCYKMSINEVEPVLQSILEKHSVITFNDYINTINYDVILRTKLVEGDTPPQQCDNWVAKFSAVTNSHWIVKNTSPYAVRVLYKKSYTCKNKKCNAKINIIFKKNNRNTRKNDPLLAQGLTAVIKIIFKHNHDVYCPAQSLSTPKLDTKFEPQSFSFTNQAPEMLKCEPRFDDDFPMDDNDDSSDDNDDDKYDDQEINKFKIEVQRILNIVEDDKTIEMSKYLKQLNGTFEKVENSQQFCELFSKILN